MLASSSRADLANFTGIDSPCEPPEDPELRIDATRLSPDEAAEEAVGLPRLSASGP